KRLRVAPAREADAEDMRGAEQPSGMVGQAKDACPGRGLVRAQSLEDAEAVVMRGDVDRGILPGHEAPVEPDDGIVSRVDDHVRSSPTRARRAPRYAGS